MTLWRRIVQWIQRLVRPDSVYYIGGSDTLPPPLPRVVRLRFVMGLSQQETARLLGVSQSCVSRWEGKARRAALDILQPG